MAFFDSWQELIGHLATIFIVLSIMQKNLTRVRVCMLLGSTCFVIYGLAVNAIPVVIANAIIGMVAIKYLVFNDKPCPTQP